MAISLTKGSTISLAKADNSPLTKVRLGLGWDEAPKAKSGGFFGALRGAVSGGEIDLDASAIMFNAQGQVQDIVYYGQLKSKDGSIRHSGDNLTGAGEGDDEQIVVNLSGIPQNVKDVVFVITSYSGQKFNQLENVFARVVDLSAGESEVVRYNLAESKDNTANIIAKITRDGAGWSFTAIGEFANGKTAGGVVNDAARFI